MKSLTTSLGTWCLPHALLPWLSAGVVILMTSWAKLWVSWPSLYSHTNENCYTLTGFSLITFQSSEWGGVSFVLPERHGEIFPCILQETRGFWHTDSCFAGPQFAGCREATFPTGITSGALSSHSCIRYMNGCDQFIDLKWSSEWIIAELKASVNGFLKSRKDNLQKLL